MKRNVWLLAACQALMMTGNSLLIATSALVGHALATDKSFATLPLALQFLATMLTTAPASMLMKQIGRRAGFTVGASIGLAGALAASYAIAADRFALFCLGALLIGMFNGFATYYRFAAADMATQDYRSRAISFVMAGGVAAAFVGPNLANWSSDWVMSARFVGSYLSLAGVYALSLLVIAWLAMPRPDTRERGRAGRPLGAIARHPTFVVAALGGMVGYGVMSLVMTATPLAMHAHAYPFAATALVIQWHVFAMFAPSFFTGHLIQRFGTLNLMFAGAALELCCVVVNLAGASVMHYWAALFLLGIGWNFLFVGATTLLTETYVPEEKAKTQALNDFLVFTTVTLAVLSAGKLQHDFGWQIVNLGVVPLPAIVLVALVWLRRHRSAAAATP